MTSVQKEAQKNTLLFVQVSEQFRGADVLKQSGCTEEVTLLVENERGERRVFANFSWPEPRRYQGPLIGFELDAGDLIAEHAELFKKLKDSDPEGVMPELLLMELLRDYGAQDSAFRL